MQVKHRNNGQPRRRFDRWRWSVCLMAVMLGCQSSQPERRPIAELMRDTIDFAADQGSRRHPGTQPGNIPVRQVAYEDGGQTHGGLFDPAVQPALLQTPPAIGDASGAGAGELPQPFHGEGAAPGRLGGPLVNEIFEETDVRHAIQALATQAKASVIIDEQVGGAATALIEGEPFEAALQKVLLPLGYVWEKKDGQYYIGTTDPKSSLYRYVSQKLEYRSQYFSPEELTALLPEGMKQYVRVVGKRNLMLIDAPRDIAQDIFGELQHADQPVPQVSLEAVVAVFSPEASFQYGVNLKQLAAKHSVQLDLSSLAMTGTITPASAAYLFGNAASTTYFLRLLEQEGYVKIRAAPHVMAKDGEKAKISIERETFFATQPVNSEFFFRQEIEKVQAGISMDITPVIRGDNITVKIARAEVSEDIRETGADPELASPYPLINRRTIETTVNVKDGETIVIGGLMQNQVVDRENRVPFFSGIPLIGHLFKQIDKQHQEAEIAIFISPRIVFPCHREVSHPYGPQLTPPQAAP